MTDRFAGGYSQLPDRLGGIGRALWAVHYEASRRRAQGDDIIMLSIGEPDMPTPPAIVEAAERSLRAGRTHYSPAEGEPEVLQALADSYTKRTGRLIEPSQLMFTPGTHTALYLVCQTLLDAGDDLLVPEPFYAAYTPVVSVTGANVVPVPLRAEEGFRLRPDDLAAKITPKTKALLLNNPHNPTGAVLSPGAVEEITRICHENGTWVISDEVYEHLVYRGTFSSPFDIDQYAEGVAVVSSLSKSHAMAGWRSGWALASPDLMHRVRQVGEAVTFGAQPFLQDAAVFALQEAADTGAEMCAIFARRAEKACSILNESEHVVAHLPDSGVFVMADISRTGMSGSAFAMALLDSESVATMPGESFGESAAGHLRISLTVPDDELAEACLRLRDFASRQALET